MKKLRNTLDLWVDETKMSIVGIGVALKRPKTIIATTVFPLLFAYILTLFKNGTGTWNLFWSGIPFGGKLNAGLSVWQRVLENFTSWDGLLIILLSVLQGLTIAMLLYVWKNREKKAAVAGLEAGGVGTALGFLALGCPSCGISLLTPLLTTIAGTGAMALADTLGWIFMILAFILLLHALRRMGYSAFIMKSSKRHKEKHAKS
ncbi:MAG: hypothetical protein ACK5MU_01080 [Candidatus Saccharimonadales bacterium]